MVIFVAAASTLFTSIGYGQSDLPTADRGSLDFKQFGLLAIQDGGRRKPIDTFARETLIRITGRSIQTDKAGRKWQANDFILSALLETHDWKNEPMVLISLGQLIEQVGLDKTQRRFSFAQLTGSEELRRMANEAHALKRAEKPLDRVQQEALNVSDRLALLGNVMNGNALLIVPSPQRETDAWMVPDPAASRTITKRGSPCLRGTGKNDARHRGRTHSISARPPVSCRTIYGRSVRRFIRSNDNCGSISTIISKDFIARSGVTGSPS
jgi:hypothetical protein